MSMSSWIFFQSIKSKTMQICFLSRYENSNDKFSTRQIILNVRWSNLGSYITPKTHTCLHVCAEVTGFDITWNTTVYVCMHLPKWSFTTNQNTKTDKENYWEIMVWRILCYVKGHVHVDRDAMQTFSNNLHLQRIKWRKKKMKKKGQFTKVQMTTHG